jgi:uncharacterized protein (DUF1015 family)
MAEFAPFHGLRYNLEKVNLSDVLAPPYDVIKGGKRDELLQKSPYNIVEVELPKGDYAQTQTDEDDAKYEHAAQVLQQWRDEGVLVLDDAAFYIYEQEFEVPGGQMKKRRGVLGALLLEEFGKGVQPHEHTLSGPKQDRLKLLRAARTNTSPIFGLYEDNDGWVTQLIDNYCTGEKPDGEARDADGIINRLWKVTDDETVNAIVAALEDEPVLIADGHHRYETALNYRNECAAKAGNAWTGSEPENFVMMMCVATLDPGLVVLPTHRLVKNVPAVDLMNLPIKLREFFDVEEVAGDSSDLLERVNEGDQIKIGLLVPETQYLLTLKDAHGDAMDLERSAAFNDLDVTILHRLILERELGIDSQKLAAGEHVGYTVHADEAQKKVSNHEYSAAFLLRPTRVEQVRECCAAGDKMPQKSTYFYPKLMTGLVLRPLDY